MRKKTRRVLKKEKDEMKKEETKSEEVKGEMKLKSVRKREDFGHEERSVHAGEAVKIQGTRGWPEKVVCCNLAVAPSLSTSSSSSSHLHLPFDLH